MIESSILLKLNLMKQIVPFLFLCLLLFVGQITYAQITTPQVRAGFGVDADLSSNFFNNAVLSGNDELVCKCFRNGNFCN